MEYEKRALFRKTSIVFKIFYFFIFVRSFHLFWDLQLFIKDNVYIRLYMYIVRVIVYTIACEVYSSIYMLMRERDF